MFPAEHLDAVVAATRPAPGFKWPWQAPSVPAAALEAELQTLLDDASGGAVAATEAFDADAFGRLLADGRGGKAKKSKGHAKENKPPRHS